MTAFSAVSIASSVAGTSSAEQVAKREQKKAEQVKPKGRTEDQDEIELHHVEHAEAIRSLTDNSGEDAREDHAEQPAYYSPSGLVRAQGAARSIDLSG